MSLIALFLVYHQARFGLSAQLCAFGERQEDGHLYLVSLFRGIDFANASASDILPYASAVVVEEVSQDRGVPVRQEEEDVQARRDGPVIRGPLPREGVAALADG